MLLFQCWRCIVPHSEIKKCCKCSFQILGDILIHVVDILLWNWIIVTKLCLYFICELMLTMQQLYYLPELVLFKALKSSSKSPQNLELSFFEYKSCRALENSCFLDLNEISWLYKQESIIFFLNLFRFFLFLCAAKLWCFYSYFIS